jgi:hypothetical protein
MAAKPHGGVLPHVATRDHIEPHLIKHGGLHFNTPEEVDEPKGNPGAADAKKKIGKVASNRRKRNKGRS